MYDFQEVNISDENGLKQTRKNPFLEIGLESLSSPIISGFFIFRILFWFYGRHLQLQHTPNNKHFYFDRFWTIFYMDFFSILIIHISKNYQIISKNIGTVVILIFKNLKKKVFAHKTHICGLKSKSIWLWTLLWT